MLNISLRVMYDTVSLFAGVLVTIVSFDSTKVCEKSVSFNRSRVGLNELMEASTYPFMTSASVPIYVEVVLPLDEVSSTLSIKRCRWFLCVYNDIVTYLFDHLLKFCGIES